MPTPMPPDPWVGALLRRLLFAAVAALVLVQFTPRSSTGRSDAPTPGAGEGTARVLPTAPRTLDPPGPGSLLPPFEADDVEHSRAGWVLLDRSEGEVLVLDPTGHPTRRFGRRGQGPGELERPLDVALADDGTVAVLDASGLRLDLFPPTGVPRRVPLAADGCTGTFGDDVVHHDDGWWVIRRCFQGPNADLEVVRVPLAGPPVRAERRALTRMNTDPHLVPLLVATDQGLFAGSNLAPCLDPVGRDGARLCLPQPARAPIPDTTSARLFGDLERRAAAVGLDLEIPTHYPALIEARSRPRGPVVRAIRPDGSAAWAEEAGDTLRILEPGGDARVEPGHDGWLLLRDDGAGLRVWVLPQPADPVGGSS